MREPQRTFSHGSRQSSRSRRPEKKRTKDGRFILEPQPEDSANDPLNWNQLRRDLALLSLGFYCMVGGGMTPLLAAGFNDVAETYDVTIPQVALTTGLYMLGLGLGSVVASPTAILWGKRPVYLGAIILFTLSSVWCALSPNYASLVTLGGGGIYLFPTGEYLQTYGPNRNPNPNLRWETKRETNIGLDFSILNNRLSGAIDVIVIEQEDGMSGTQTYPVVHKLET